MGEEQGVWCDHPQLYHYTNQRGLLGILETQDLYASSYRFLNDAQEIYYFHDLASDVLLPVFKEHSKRFLQMAPQAKTSVELLGGTDQVARNDLNAFLSNLFKVSFSSVEGRPENVHPFVLSFCGHKDEYERRNGQLSQWRGYGAGGGYALEFATRHLSDLIGECVRQYSISVGHFCPVLYGDGMDVRQELASELQLLKTAAGDFYSSGASSSIERAYQSFVKSCTVLKHQGFREESEVRVVIAPMLKNSDFSKLDDNPRFKKIYSRQGYSGPMSYIKLLEETDKPLPINKIIVGPGARQEKNYDAVRFAVGEREINVVKSETPYIG
ncbi:MAG: DUF2971 domain-containing protein [Thalassospira sp.]|uniref:DUF2971 domain-containing protein n=1 Tax=Thalassospira sp. TaxID=1912094 RepID=UPI0032EF35A2